METNKRIADNWSTSESKKPCSDHVNMLRAGKDPNQFMVTCLLDASKDIMEHITKEAQRIKEFNALDLKRKEVVLKNVSDMIFIRCNNIMLNKIVCGEKHTTTLYFKTYPKGRGLDEEIMRMIMDTQNKMESKCSASNCPTSESTAVKMELKSSTSNCFTLELKKISVPNNILDNPNPVNMLREEPNKRSADDWPTFESKKTCTDHMNMLKAGKDPNQFMVTSLRDATKDIMKHVTKEAEKIKEFKALDVKQKDLVLKKISDMISTRCYGVMLNKIVCGEKHTTMLYYKTYPKGRGLDEEIVRMLVETPNNPCSDKVESKSSASNCPTSELSSDKIESKGSTSNCPTSESNSNKIESKGSTSNCPTSESNSDKMESKGSTSNCPTSETNSDKIESKGSTSNCPTSESSSDKIESKGSTSNCPTSESSSDKIESKGSTSNCPTSESNSDKIESNRSTSNCPKSESNSNKIKSKGSTSNCPTSESNLDKIQSKRSTSNCPTSDSNKIWIPNNVHGNPDPLNMLRPETNLNSFELTCFQESVRDIMKHVNQEALKINEFNALDVKQKDVVLKKVSDVIFTRCKFFMKNKVIDSHTRITKIYFTKFPKYKGLDGQIQKMLMEVPNYPSLYEFVDFEVLPQAEQINKIFCDKIDMSVEECFKKMITNIRDYEDEKDILQCIDELPSIEDIDDESDKLDKSVDSTVENDIEGLNDLNKVKSDENTAKSDTEVLTDLNKVINDYEPERKKLKEYYKIIDWFLVPKIENLLESYKSEFREILKNDKEYVLEEAKITLQLRDEFDKSLKVKKKTCQKRRCLIECKLETNENDDDDKEMNSKNDDMGEEMNSQNIDLSEEMNSQNDDIVEGMYAQNVDTVEEMNSEKHYSMDEEENSANKDSKGHDNYRNEDEKERERNRLVHQICNVMTKPDPVYRVKLISMPYLPSKELILEFLNQFNTKAIKKHKKLKNLLVIDLNTENDYNNILKACGTKIGPHKLLIRRNESNDSDIKEHNENVNTPSVNNNSGNIPEIVKVIKQEPNQRDDKISDERDRNSEVRKHVKQEPSDERDKNTEISDKVIKQGPNDETIDVRTIKAEKEANGEKVDEKIENSELNSEKAPVSTSQEVDIHNSQLVAKLCATPVLPEKEAIAYFIKKYNPTAIKKHKKFDNILIITFNNNNDYENFLSMDGHCINFSELTIVKVPQIEKSCKKPNVAKEQTNVKGSNKEHVSNDETIDGSKMNNEKVLDRQKTVASAINTINKERKCLKGTTNNKLEFSTAATFEHEIKNTTNDKTLDERTALNNNTKVVNCQKTVTSTINIIDEDMTCPKEPTNSKTEKASVETVIDIKEREFKNGLNDETLDERTTLNNNNNKVVSSQKPVAITINTLEKVCTKETIDSKTNPAIAETVIDINKEHKINKVLNDETSDEGTKMNVDTLVLDKQNEIDTKEHEVNIKNKKVESNINSEGKTCDIYTLLDNTIIKTEKIDDDKNINSEPDIDCNVIRVKKEDILEIKQEIAEVSGEVIVKENNIQLGLKTPKIEIEEDNTNIVVNNQNVGSEEDMFLTSEKFHPTLKIGNSNNTVDIILCENELREHLGPNLNEIVTRKITETFSKIEKINKETNFELLNCKELEDRKLSEHTKELFVKTDVNKTKSNDETQITEETFFKKLNVLKDNILTVLNQDDEYITVKSTITENTKSLRK